MNESWPVPNLTKTHRNTTKLLQGFQDITSQLNYVNFISSTIVQQVHQNEFFLHWKRSLNFTKVNIIYVVWSSIDAIILMTFCQSGTIYEFVIPIVSASLFQIMDG